jgi:hypothetical protein
MRPHPILFRLIKMFDIGYLTVLHFLLAVGFGKLLDVVYGKFDKEAEDKKPLTQVFLEVMGMFWVTGLFIYIYRNVITYFPSPFDGYFGFKHALVKEITDGSVFVLVFFYAQETQKQKFLYLINKLNIMT